MTTEVIFGTLSVTPGTGSHDFQMPPGLHPATVIFEPVNPTDIGTATFPARNIVNIDPWTQVASFEIGWNCTAASPVNYNYWITVSDTPVSFSSYGGS